MELIRGRERDCGQEYLVRLSSEERERLESLVLASTSSCATADEGGQLTPSTGLRARCLFSSSRIALIFGPRQKNARCLCGWVVDHTRSKSPGGDTSARAPTPANDSSLRIPAEDPRRFGCWANRRHRHPRVPGSLSPPPGRDHEAVRHKSFFKAGSLVATDCGNNNSSG
jgi:hypothetical protein